MLGAQQGRRADVNPQDGPTSLIDKAVAGRFTATKQAFSGCSPVRVMARVIVSVSVQGTKIHGAKSKGLKKHREG